MVHICNSKTKRRILCRTVNVLHYGLLVSAVFMATINIVHAGAIDCGTVITYRQAIRGGTEVVKDEWPFIAALYNSITSTYFCGGTIISQRHVLTAAHCVRPKFTGVQTSPDDITVRLGAYNLTDRSETDVVDKNVTQIIVHPDWQVNHQRYDADIAILVLNEPMTFSTHIRPVCMPPADFFIDGLTGTVVGWGRTENGTAEGIPRKIEVNVSNDTYCYETDDGIASYTSERAFCGVGSGTPKEGDSGGGFFAVAGSGWVQFGTVSFIRPKTDILKNAVYMKLTSLRDWIAAKVEQSGYHISLATTKSDLNGTFGYLPPDTYGCWLFDLNIRQENFVVENVIGLHDIGKGNDDVEMIAFEGGVMASLPRNFGNMFRNLKFVAITVDTRRIFRSNFQDCEHVVSIMFWNGTVVEFDENSLWDVPNLQSLTLERNKLKLLHAATFSRNYKLRSVEMSSNAFKSLPRNLFRNNSLLEIVLVDENSIETLSESIFEGNANLRQLSLKGNRLTHVSENLFRNNSELRLIDLSNNLIKTIDEQSFAANSELFILSLSHNKLEFLPAQLLRGLTQLNMFFVNGNALKAVDEQFFETNERVESIFLHSNQLTRIPPNLFRNNWRLQSVDLGRNSIETIDENSFKENSLLQNVTLHYNRIVKLPGNLFRHNSMLEFVDFRRNLLETIDEHTFELNTKLREIHFDGNYLTVIPGTLFQNNLLLASVHFDANALDEIDERTFQTNANLQAVHLAANMLNYLPQNLFRNNSLLETVDLSSNLFSALDEKSYSYDSDLMKFVVTKGVMQSFPRDIFQYNPRLKHINLGGIETTFTD